MRHLRRFVVPLALALPCSLAGTTSVFAQSEASQAVFAVTLQAQLRKTWNYVSTREEDGCTSQTRVRGSRTVTLRSARPTLVTVSFAGGRARYSSGVVRFLGGTAGQSGAVTVVGGGAAGCRRATRRTSCARPRRAVANAAARFFRSRKNRIAFARTRDFTAGLPAACPPQAVAVRAERPSLHLAEGEISERGLFDARYSAQTGFGSVEETTDFEGDANGKVVVRVNWHLTFTRVR
jgi:hypothetical protein